MLPSEFKSINLGRPFDTYCLFFFTFGGPTLLQFGSIEIRHIVKLGLIVPFFFIAVQSKVNIVALVVMGALVLINCWRIELNEKGLFLQIKMSEQKTKNVQRIFETANTPIFCLDPSGRFLYCNEVLIHAAVVHTCNTLTTA